MLFITLFCSSQKIFDMINSSDEATLRSQGVVTYGQTPGAEASKETIPDVILDSQKFKELTKKINDALGISVDAQKFFKPTGSADLFQQDTAITHMGTILKMQAAIDYIDIETKKLIAKQTEIIKEIKKHNIYIDKFFPLLSVIIKLLKTEYNDFIHHNWRHEDVINFTKGLIMQFFQNSGLDNNEIDDQAKNFEEFFNNFTAKFSDLATTKRNDNITLTNFITDISQKINDIKVWLPGFCRNAIANLSLMQETNEAKTAIETELTTKKNDQNAAKNTLNAAQLNYENYKLRHVSPLQSQINQYGINETQIGLLTTKIGKEQDPTEKRKLELFKSALEAANLQILTNFRAADINDLETQLKTQKQHLERTYKPAVDLAVTNLQTITDAVSNLEGIKTSLENLIKFFDTGSSSGYVQLLDIKNKEIQTKWDGMQANLQTKYTEIFSTTSSQQETENKKVIAELKCGEKGGFAEVIKALRSEFQKDPNQKIGDSMLLIKSKVQSQIQSTKSDVKTHLFQSQGQITENSTLANMAAPGKKLSAEETPSLKFLGVLLRSLENNKTGGFDKADIKTQIYNNFCSASALPANSEKLLKIFLQYKEQFFELLETEKQGVLLSASHSTKEKYNTFFFFNKLKEILEKIALESDEAIKTKKTNISMCVRKLKQFIFVSEELIQKPDKDLVNSLFFGLLSLSSQEQKKRNKEDLTISSNILLDTAKYTDPPTGVATTDFQSELIFPSLINDASSVLKPNEKCKTEDFLKTFTKDSIGKYLISMFPIITIDLNASIEDCVWGVICGLIQLEIDPVNPKSLLKDFFKTKSISKKVVANGLGLIMSFTEAYSCEKVPVDSNKFTAWGIASEIDEYHKTFHTVKKKFDEKKGLLNIVLDSSKEISNLLKEENKDPFDSTYAPVIISDLMQLPVCKKIFKKIFGVVMKYGTKVFHDFLQEDWSKMRDKSNIERAKILLKQASPYLTLFMKDLQNIFLNSELPQDIQINNPDQAAEDSKKNETEQVHDSKQVQTSSILETSMILTAAGGALGTVGYNQKFLRKKFKNLFSGKIKTKKITAPAA